MNTLISTIYDAVSDYSANGAGQSTLDWLQDYLGDKLPSKSVDVIHAVSQEILDTLDLMEQKKAGLDEAVRNGKSAEIWLANDIMSDSESNGEKARKAAAFFNGIVSAEKGLGEAVDVDYVDVSEDNDEWQDTKWNDYKLKDTLKGLAVDSGRTGLREIAADVFLKASEEGISGVFSDREFVTDTLVNGAAVGLKAAVAAGLTVAESNGILPPTSASVVSTIAFKTVESAKSIAEVVKGKISMTEALVNIKNAAVATISGLWEQHKGKLVTEAVDTVGKVFGPIGAVVAGAVRGLIADTGGESRIKTVLKEAGKAALRFLTKEIHIPLFGKIKEALQVKM